MPDTPRPPDADPASPAGRPSAPEETAVSPPGQARGATDRSLTTLLARAARLRCPVCGQGALFRGLLTMNKRCTVCGLWYERASGYFLGSIYFNYAASAVIASAAYLLPMIWLGRPPQWLLAPIVGFCVVFPLFFFRYARSLWLALDHYLSGLNPDERPGHEV